MSVQVSDYQQSYRVAAEHLRESEGVLVGKLRERAMRHLQQQGWPDRKQEAWRYSGLEQLTAKPYQPLTPDGDELMLDIGHLPKLEGGLSLLFVNGCFYRRQQESLPEGVEVIPLSRLLREAPERVEGFASEQLSRSEDGFSLLNSAFMHTGCSLRIKRGVVVEQPLQLLFINTTRQKMVNIRNLIELEEGAEATVVEHYLSTPQSDTFVNSLSQLRLGSDSRLHHCLLQQQAEQNLHISRQWVEQQPGSHFDSALYLLDGLVSRNELRVNLQQQAECRLNGLYLAAEGQVRDTYSVVNHLQPTARSEQLYKGLMAERSRGSFFGELKVAEGAQQSVAKQYNRNLLLAETAEADSRPQMDIRADDVQCSHGSSSGQLERAALFYLRARGLSLAVAQRLLVDGFCREVVEPLSNDGVRLLVAKVVEQRLAKLIEVPMERDHGD